jgi:hypothetical protein
MDDQFQLLLNEHPRMPVMPVWDIRSRNDMRLLANGEGSSPPRHSSKSGSGCGGRETFTSSTLFHDQYSVATYDPSNRTVCQESPVVFAPEIGQLNGYDGQKPMYEGEVEKIGGGLVYEPLPGQPGAGVLFPVQLIREGGQGYQTAEQDWSFLWDSVHSAEGGSYWPPEPHAAIDSREPLQSMAEPTPTLAASCDIVPSEIYAPPIGSDEMPRYSTDGFIQWV